MLIDGKLPNIYNSDINGCYMQLKDYNLKGENSIHYWINDIKDENLLFHLNKIRNAPEIKKNIQENYTNHEIISVHNSDEIYLSVSPKERKGSDIALSDCHYDAPFKYIYQGGNIFLRVILALNENDSVYTEVENKKSLISKSEYNIIDYNQDYHCVHGEIPKNKNRVLLKLHFIAKPNGSPQIWTDFCEYINNSWTHLSRELMRNSIEPKTFLETIFQYIVLGSRYLWSYTWYILAIIFIILCYYLYPFKKIRIKNKK